MSQSKTSSNTNMEGVHFLLALHLIPLSVCRLLTTPFLKSPTSPSQYPRSEGCVWFAFLGQLGPQGGGERRLIACTAPEPGSTDAIFPLLPASPETPETSVSAELGSARAVVSLTDDVLVYD
jgi:hypothetical protein